MGSFEMYPVESITADANGTVTSIKFRCSAHGNPVASKEDNGGCTECYEAEVAAFSRASLYVAYLTNPPDQAITTFGGGHLAKVTDCRLTPRKYTPTGGTFRRVYVRAESPGGVQWWGTGTDNTTQVRLHRVRSTTPPGETVRELTVVSFRHLDVTSNSNPRYAVTFGEITGEVLTVSDSSHAYAVSDLHQGDRVQVQLTRGNRIRYITLLSS